MKTLCFYFLMFPFFFSLLTKAHCLYILNASKFILCHKVETCLVYIYAFVCVIDTYLQVIYIYIWLTSKYQ